MLQFPLHSWQLAQDIVLLCCPYHSVVSSSLQPHGLCSPAGSSVHGILWARILEWVTMPSSRGSSQPRIEPRSPILQADSLPSESPKKLKNPKVGSLSLLQGIFPTQELTRVSCIAGGFFISWATREAQHRTYNRCLIHIFFESYVIRMP